MRGGTVRYLSIFIATLVTIASLSSISSAGGLLVPHQDSAAMGMANAFVGQADNPSAVWYNPAGITDLDGKRVSAGIIAIYPVFTHENTDGTTDVAKRKVFFPPHFYATEKMSDSISLGLGINSPFGLSDDWSVTSSTAGVATFTELKSININPAVAYKISDSLSVAFGLDYIILDATMERVLAPGVQLKLEGDGSGWGANAGIKYKAGERVSFGLSYRSRAKIKLDGTADVSAMGLSNSAHTELPLADIAQFGVSCKVTDDVILNADLDYEWWSTFKNLDIQSNTILALSGGTTDTAVFEKDWRNTLMILIGGQYRLSEQWKLRAGYFHDQTAVSSERFESSYPDAEKQAVSIGAGYTSGNITVDASYMYSWFNARTISNSLAGGDTPVTSLDGTYKSYAHLAGITMTYKF
jgi:long-chain fatty acid transport protein